jgi:hypothetical protein
LVLRAFGDCRNSMVSETRCSDTVLHA